MPSCRHWVSYHGSGTEYHQSHQFLSPLLKSVTLSMKIKSRSNKPVDPSNFYGPSLARSQSLIIHHLISTLSKMPLRCYSLLLMKWRVLQWQPVTYLISNTIRITVSCNECFCFLAKEEKLDILTIPLSPNINSNKQMSNIQKRKVKVSLIREETTELKTFWMLCNLTKD